MTVTSKAILIGCLNIEGLRGWTNAEYEKDELDNSKRATNVSGDVSFMVLVSGWIFICLV
jgi:hypothetical protein